MGWHALMGLLPLLTCSRGAVATETRLLPLSSVLAGEFEQAGALCPKVLKTNQSLWEHYVYMFIEIRQHRVRCRCRSGDCPTPCALNGLSVSKSGAEGPSRACGHVVISQIISKYLPKDNPRLSPAVYEMVLHHFLQEENPQTFLKTIREWPPGLYNTHVIISAVNDRLKTDPGNGTLMEAVAELCVPVRARVRWSRERC